MYDDPRLTPEIVFRIYASRRRLYHENPQLHAEVYGSDDPLRPPPCDPPTVLGVIPGPRSVTVVFEPVRKKPADGGATSYVLRVNHACSHVIEMEIENVKETAYTVTGLSIGRVFTVTVASKNLVGVGSFSAPSDPFLPLPPPKTPPARGSKASGKKKSPQNVSPMQPQADARPVPPPAPEAKAGRAPQWVHAKAGERSATSIKASGKKKSPQNATPPAQNALPTQPQADSKPAPRPALEAEVGRAAALDAMRRARATASEQTATSIKASGKKKSPQNALPTQPQAERPVPPPAPEAKAGRTEDLDLEPPRWVRVRAGVRRAIVSFENLQTPDVHRWEVSYVLRVRDVSGRVVKIESIKEADYGMETSHFVDNLTPGVDYTVSVASCSRQLFGRFSRPSAPFTPLPSAGTDAPIHATPSGLVTKPSHLHTPNSPPRASINHSPASKANPGPSATSTAHSIAPNAKGENKPRQYERRVPAQPPAPAILGITPGPRRVSVRFAEAGASSFVLRLHNLTSGHVREVAGVTRSPHTLHGLCNGEAYTLAISARGGGHAAGFSAPSEPFVPSARV